MSKHHVKYIVKVCLIAFAVWVVGEAVLLFAFPEVSMTIARLWVIGVFGAACIWSIVHLVREENKEIEDEENDNYKGVY